MDKVLVNIDVVQGILSAYRRADSVQSRIYGILLGSKKNNIYHIKDAVYGYIFQSENPEKNQKQLVKMNDEIIKSLLNSLTQKFKTNNQNIPYNKTMKENEIKFQTNDTLMILGGFATDKELFSDLYSIHNTLDRVPFDFFNNINEILLLVDPNHKGENNIEYGIKAYKWDINTIKIKGLPKSSSFISFKELKTNVVKQLNNYEIISNNGGQNILEKLDKLQIDKNDKKTFSELLMDVKNEKDNSINKENNNEFIKRKIKGAIEYLSILQEFLEDINNKEKAKDKDELNVDEYNLIASIISEIDPILNDEEIMKVINKDINNKYTLDSLAQLIDVQMNLSDKIRELVK